MKNKAQLASTAYGPCEDHEFEFVFDKYMLVLSDVTIFQILPMNPVFQVYEGFLIFI